MCLHHLHHCDERKRSACLGVDSSDLNPLSFAWVLCNHFRPRLLCVTQLRWGMEAEKERELAQGRRRQLTEAEELQPWAGEPAECDPRLARYAAVCAVQ